MMRTNKMHKNEKLHDYLLRMAAEGILNFENNPVLMGKLLDKEVGNAATIVLSGDLSETMSEEEMREIFKQAGVTIKDDKPRPTKH